MASNFIYLFCKANSCRLRANEAKEKNEIDLVIFYEKAAAEFMRRALGVIL